MRGLKVFLISAGIFAFFDRAYAIAFAKSYGGTRYDVGYSVQQTSDGGYIMAGIFTPSASDSGDVILIKVDSLGNVLWSKRYRGPREERAFSVKQTSDGGYITVARTKSFVDTNRWDVLLIKTDPNGNLQWARVYSNPSLDDEPSDVIETSDGGYLVVGGAQSRSSSSQNEILVMKINSSGDLQWVRWFGDTIYQDQAYSVKRTSDGGYIVVGRTGSYGSGNADIFLMKLDGSGNVVWARAYGSSGPDFGYDVQITSDGGFVVVGYYTSSGDTNAIIVKTNSSGNVQWYRVLGGTQTDVFYSVAQTSDGGFIATGRTHSFGSGNADVFLARFNSSGTLQWSKTYGGSQWDHASSIQQTSDGGYVMLGRTRSFTAGNFDFFLIKTDALGNIGTCGIVQNISPTISTPTLNTVSFSPRVMTPTYNTSVPSLTVANVTLTVNAPCPLSEDNELEVSESCQSRIRAIETYKGGIRIKGAGDFEVKIYKATGKLVKALKGKNEVRIELSRGVYFVEVVSGGKVIREKVIIR
jgi:uncharacterized delta-60 repeat protein